MRVTLWGTRGSLATPGPETARYGGNTSCVGVRGREGTMLVLDAGTGVRRVSATLNGNLRRVDVLLTHLHMDHIQGLGFFGPLYRPDVAVHIWGPASTKLTLRERLMRYLSPPLFPVCLRELPSEITLHEVPCGEVDIGEFRVTSALVCHPGPTVGYRIAEPGGGVLTYLPDHEPALGARRFPLDPEWTSGFELAHDVDLLLHDAQYTREEYPSHAGWGHSTMHDALAFGRLANVRHLAPFHHDPGRDDTGLEKALDVAMAEIKPDFHVTPAAEGHSFDI